MDIIRYIDFIRYFEFQNHSKPGSLDKLMHKALVMFPRRLKSELKGFFDDKEYRALMGNKRQHIKSYHTFCFDILNIITRRPEVKTCYLNEHYFHNALVSSRLNGQSSLAKDKTITDLCAFILKSNTTNLIFSFGHQGARNLRKLSDHIFSLDQNKFSYIHIIIFKNAEELHEARQFNKAAVYKRCFFTSFSEICEQAMEADIDSYEKIFSLQWDYGKSVRKRNNTAGTQKIEVIDNLPVGKENAKLYKLVFRTDDPIDITPGQFVMISTAKEKEEFKPGIVNSIAEIKPGVINDLQTKQISFLKRPFGIYRAFYENFGADYISALHLDKRLAAILYTIIPNQFEIVYKVLDKGVGTNELTRLVKGDKVSMLAPLGRLFDFRELAREEIDEIHIVGGGVGMAPLIYLVQVLKFLNFNVKAFVGIEDFHSLIYNSINTKGIAGNARNANLYTDDLKMMGLSEASDIYVSLLCNTAEEKLEGITNVFKGSLVTEPYDEYLKKHGNLKIRTFTCGPLSMMQKVHHITARYNITSYVLMEKRMACGIGVCFSCVCKTLVNGKDHYSRVCIDGPIIESKQINWNE